MSVPPRVAFFPDCYVEVNGVAPGARASADYASRRDLPLLCVHIGTQTRLWREGSVTFLELRRSPVGFGLEFDLRFDLASWRYLPQVSETVRRFRPDVLHITGPTDVGLLRALYRAPCSHPDRGFLAHEPASIRRKRVLRRLRWMPPGARRRHPRRWWTCRSGCHSSANTHVRSSRICGACQELPCSF